MFYKMHVPEAGAEMDAHVAMAFLKSVVFTNVMKIIPADYDSPLHLQFLNYSCQDTSSDRHVASKRAFFVDVRAFESLKREVMELTVTRDEKGIENR